MTTPASLMALLDPGEDLLWHSHGYASDRLSDYGGVHDFIARAFFVISSVGALLNFLAMQKIGHLGLNLGLVITVICPLVIGLGVRAIGRRRARAKAQNKVYGVTSHAILVTGTNVEDVYPIDADTIAEIVSSTAAHDVLQFKKSSEVTVTVQPHARSTSRTSKTRTSTVVPQQMILPAGEAEKAQTVINLVKASL